MPSYKKLLSTRAVALLLALCIFLLSTCTSRKNDKVLAEPVVNLVSEKNMLVGSSACKSCHQEIYDNYVRTAHKATSAPADLTTVKGSFVPGHNSFSFGKGDSVVMRSTDSGLYQFNYVGGELKFAVPFSIVVGSGTKGQSYLYWRDGHLFQLPMSFYAGANIWSNSPGFTRFRAHFDRPIHSECMGCHGSFTDVDYNAGSMLEVYNPKTLVMGVNCERCHGPGANHVLKYTKDPKATGDPLLVNAARLSRVQQLDACGVCHASIYKTMNPMISFRTGDTLLMIPEENLDTTGKIDVHGNQYGMLKRSKCFIASNTMTCSTCHDPHKAERGSEAVFSQRCMSCHTDKNTDFAKMAPTMAVADVKQKCVTCHMPTQESKTLTIRLRQDSTLTRAQMRSHLIKVYPDSIPSIATLIKKH